MWPSLVNISTVKRKSISSRESPVRQINLLANHMAVMSQYCKMDTNEYSNIFDGTYLPEISKYILMQHINETNIQIYLYSGNSTNTNMNHIQRSFYSNIQIFVLITDYNFF